MASAIATARAFAGDPLESLTPAEREAYDLIARGVPALRAPLGEALNITAAAAAKRLAALKLKGAIPRSGPVGAMEPFEPIQHIENHLEKLDVTVADLRAQIERLEATRAPYEAALAAYRLAAS